MSIKSIFVVWAPYSRRAETLSAALGGEGKVWLHYEDRLKGRWLTPLRYLAQTWNTWRYLQQEQPEVVLVQSPPIFATLAVAAWCEWQSKFGRVKRQPRYVLDCHPATWYHPKWRWARPLIHLLTQRAAVTLCTNEGAQDILREWNVKGFFLSDGIPTLSPASGTIGSQGEIRVGVIGSLDDDESTAEVFAAARLLPNVTFYITGNEKKLPADLLARKPENITMTGFLRNGDYTALLQNMHGLVILTNISKAVNCAAYEAVAMGKPTVVSDWLEMRHSFSRGFVYVRNTPEEIAAGIKKMLDERATLTAEVISLRSELASKWQSRFEDLLTILQPGSQPDSEVAALEVQLR